MSFVKISCVMRVTLKDGRPFGWTENFIVDGQGSDPVAEAVRYARTFQSRRLQLSSGEVQMTAIRATNLDIVGARPVTSKMEPPLIGQTGLEMDFPNTAILVRASTPFGRSRSYRWAAIADEYVDHGVLVPSGPANTVLNFLRTSIKARHYIESVDNTQPKVPISSIAADGTVTTAEAHGLVVGQTAQILRCYSNTGKLVSGLFRVVAVDSSYVLHLGGWNVANVVVDSGRIRRYVVNRVAISVASGAILAPRKLGRPSGLSRARKFSKRVR